MSKNYVKTSTGTWEVVIGLEVHTQIKTNSKLFSGAATTFAGEPNSQVSFVDAAMPGMLPVPNKACIEQTVKTGLALNALINLVSVFDRKNYFYPDLPQGYQISQLYHPIVGPGYLEIDIDDTVKKIGIERIHIEQDAGKSVHDVMPSSSLIDLNRSGIGLMEIVTQPDIRSGEEAMEFIRKLRLLLWYLGTSDANMEEGSLRADVNISMHRPGTPFGTRAEIKNVNSIRFIGQAIEYEINRQIGLLEEGEQVVQETRLFDAAKGVTRSMRGKEDAQDYRYFPDPDLLPVILDEGFVQGLKDSLPELPDQKKKRFMESYGLSKYDASVIISDIRTPTYFESAVKNAGEKEGTAKLIANWVTTELFRVLKEESLEIDQSKIPAASLAELVNLIQDGTISGRTAKEVFLDMWTTGKPAKIIVEEKGLLQISNTSELEQLAENVIQENPDVVQKYKAGKDKLLGFFVGKMMQLTGGKANPKIVNEILVKKLSE